LDQAQFWIHLGLKIRLSLSYRFANRHDADVAFHFSPDARNQMTKSHMNQLRQCIRRDHRMSCAATGLDAVEQWLAKGNRSILIGHMKLGWFASAKNGELHIWVKLETII
jgi:hypothetical protein